VFLIVEGTCAVVESVFSILAIDHGAESAPHISMNIRGSSGKVLHNKPKNRVKHFLQANYVQ